MFEENIVNKDIRDCYREDTVGRKYHASITTKKGIGDIKGEVSEPMSMNLHKPMKWKEFKALSDSMKRMYLEHLVATYSVTCSEIADMLEISHGYFYHAINQKLKFNGYAVNGRNAQTKEQRKAWSEFIGKVDIVPEEAAEEVEVVEDVTCTAPVNSFKFSQTGKLNTDELINRITALVSEGTNCTVRVSLTVES